MKVLKNYDDIFEEAIKNGIFSKDEKEKTYVGYFMYMYTEKEKHYFKHKVTRRYGYDRETILSSCDL